MKILLLCGLYYLIGVGWLFIVLRVFDDPLSIEGEFGAALALVFLWPVWLFLSPIIAVFFFEEIKEYFEEKNNNE